MMAVRSLSFDDDDDSEVCVFSGPDLLISHYDSADLDWQEVAERSAIDERRGLVITQVAVLEDLVDEVLIYMEDPADVEEFRRKLDQRTLGPRLDLLDAGLRRRGLLDERGLKCLTDLRTVAQRRNQLAHGTVHLRLVRLVPICELSHGALQLEWVLVDRRSRQTERISMARLRQDVADAVGAFMGLLAFVECLVERAPVPTNFRGGAYLRASRDG